MSDLGKRAEAVFRAVLDHQGDSESYLKNACGDDAELLQLVQCMLAGRDAGQQAPGSGDEDTKDQVSSRSVVVTATHQSRESNSEQIGPYKLLGQIGEGGMGTVWLAQQTSPIKRKVAIKLIKAGMDSQQFLARFEAERQALAMMDHPNIARVLDGGISADGRPYFAMEYVQGVPLTQYCDKEQLSVRDRLELFHSICSAVQHAHQKGIIHRDLKPSNILICIYDGKPVPKVIDFGLAKALHHTLTDKTLFTAHGVMVGTPLYVSPEQAEHNPDIDTRTDVYALGVILYELLTGSTPIERERIKEAAFDEVLRMIKDVDPPRPSTRLSGSHDLKSVAAQRNIEPGRLTRAIAGDLDWVVMKALEKERARRYETANALAEDVRRHLADEPVSAGPPSAVYRLQKFLRRNRAAVIATTMIAATLLLGIVGTTAGFFWALSEKKSAEDARLAESKAKASAIKSADSAERERIRAEENFDAARQAVEQYLVSVTENEKLTEADFSDLRKELLQSAAPFFERLKDQNPGDVGVESSRANAFYRLASLQQESADLSDARANFEQAIVAYRRLENEYPDTPDYRLQRGRCHFGYGKLLNYESDFESARIQWEESRSLLQSLAESHPQMADAKSMLALSIVALAALHREMQDAIGQVPTAETLTTCRELLSEAEEIQKKLVEEYPENADYRRELAATYNNTANVFAKLGDLDGAIQSLRQALAAFETIPTQTSSSPVICHNNLAYFLTNAGQLEAAKDELMLAQSKAERLVKEFPSIVHHQVQLGITYYRQGNVAAYHDHEEALEWYDRAEEVLSSVLNQHPNHSEASSRLFNVDWNRAESLYALGRYSEAARAFRVYADKRRATNELLAAQGEDRIADCWNAIGNQFAAQRDHALARLEYLKAIAIQEPLATNFRDVPEFRAKLARSHYNLGNTLSGIGTPPGLGDQEAAEVNYQSAIEHFTNVLEADSSVGWYRKELGDALENLSTLLSELGRLDAAHDQTMRALEIRTALTQDFPDVAEYQVNLAQYLHRLQRYEDAIEAYQNAIQMDGSSPVTHLFAGLAYFELGHYEDAIAAYENALSVKSDYALAHNNIGWAQFNLGRPDEALVAFHRALEIDSDDTLAKSNLLFAEAVQNADQVLAGVAEPTSPEQRISIAKYCVLPGRKLYLNAAQQLQLAFGEKPELAEPNEVTHRYNAACCALLAIAGRGHDAAELSPEQIATWRQQALKWLREDLQVHAEKLKSTDAELREQALKTVTFWLEDSDLEQVRDPMELMTLPDEDRQAWQKFWQQVRQVCDE